MPQDEPPKYLKAGKKDKAEVLKRKLARKRERIESEPTNGNAKGNGTAKVTIKPKVIEKNQNQIGTSSVVEKPKLKPKG